MKKIFALLIVFTVLLGGCSQKPVETTSLKFTEYLDQLLIDSFNPSDIGINFSFINPEFFGIIPEPYNLGFTSEEDYLESIEESKQILLDLKSFKDENLSEQERLDKDALISDFEHLIKSQDYYEFEIGANVLGYSRAFSGNVPAYLETFDFHNESDVIAYLNFLETLKESYRQYLELEFKRQSSGRGYGQEELDRIIKQAQLSADAMRDTDYFLIEDFQMKIKALSLNQEQIYIDEQRRLMNEDVADAYQLIVDTLSLIDAKPTTGLANKPDGKKYYQYLLQKNTGSSRSIKQIRSFIKKKKAEIMVNLAYIGNSDAMFERLMSNDFGEFGDAYELLAFIDNAMSKDFPKIDDVNFEIKKVHPSMSEASSPAFYFTPYVDYTNEYKQSIFINGEFDNKLYRTYAHEGFPGHMYQFNYFLGLDMHPIRNVYTHSSNAEGWANYIESIAYSYIETDSEFISFSENYNNLVQILHIEMDLGVNYDGWSLFEFKTFLDSNFSQMDDETILDIYMSFTHNPAVYPTYYLSSLYIQDMKEQVKKQKGSDFSELEFHRMFLDSGSAGFDTIQRRIDRYLEASE